MLSGFDVKLPGIRPELHTHVETAGINAYNNSFEALVEDVITYKKHGYRTVIAAASRSRARRLKDELFEHGIECGEISNGSRRTSDTMQSGSVYIVSGSITRGFSYDNRK